MKMNVELQQKKQKALIVTKDNSQFISLIKSQLKTFEIETFVSPHLPDDIQPYSLCFFIDEPHYFIDEFLANKEQKFIFVFFDQEKTAKTLSSYVHDRKAVNIKVINLITYPNYFKDDIDKVFWFAFSRSNETYLHIFHPKLTQHLPPPPKKVRKPLFTFSYASLTKPRTLIIIGVVLIVTSHILFIPFLALSTFFNYRAAIELKDKQYDISLSHTKMAKGIIQVSRALYEYARPTLLLFSIARYPDDLFALNNSANDIVTTAFHVQEKGKEMVAMLFKKDKTKEDVDFFVLQKEQVIKDFENISEDLTLIGDKIPDWTDQLKDTKAQLNTTTKLFESIKPILPHLDSIFAKGTTKTYLLFFANNMELRPGGGFIGSFGILKIKDYTVEELKVYDVYDADGQLTAHVEPPKPLAQYLNQPHFFLRDSAFSPDFLENYKQAQFFLEKEMQLTHFDGAILVTTTGIQNLLEAMGEQYIPDYKEKVNKDNFYIKAQLYAEKGFFPGSIQKKKFLSSVMDQMLINVETAPFPKVVQMIKKSLDEKQMVIYLEDSDLQKQIDELYWSGRTLLPNCTKQINNCLVDYILPVDANLGVNKANFYITRPIALNVSIDPDGYVHNVMTIRYKNDSLNDIFPGGKYKNYLQVLLPKDAQIKNVQNNGIQVGQYDQRNETYKIIGMLVEVKPQSQNMLQITYDVPSRILRGNGLYQLIVQKQIGSANSDFQLQITLPENMYVVNKNFSPLVNKNQIIYNTTIKSDKIFLVEFYKE